MFLDQDATALTMKNMKEALTAPWTREIEASHFFYELVHDIARAFMVGPLVWPLPILLHGRFTLTAACTGGQKCQPIDRTGYFSVTHPISRPRCPVAG